MNKPLSEEEFEKQYLERTGGNKYGKARNDELYRALKEKDYPDDFCREIAYNQIRTDYTGNSYAGVSLQNINPRAEDVVDEMLAISVIEMRHAEKGAGTCSGNNQSDLQRRIIRRGEHEYEQS